LKGVATLSNICASKLTVHDGWTVLNAKWAAFCEQLPTFVSCVCIPRKWELHRQSLFLFVCPAAASLFSQMGACGSKSGSKTPASIANNSSAASDDTPAASGAGAPQAAVSPVQRAVDEARSSGKLDLSAKSGIRSTQIGDALVAAEAFLGSVTEVSLKEQRLAEFPEKLLACIACKVLDVSQNVLLTIPDNLGTAMPKLVSLTVVSAFKSFVHV
jgi:hypothetical protein